MRWLVVPTAAALMAAASAPAGDARTAILAAMTDSAAGWNSGDLARFMAVYAPDAVYVTPKGLVRGKAAIVERYRASFADGGNVRGRLTFGDTSFRTIDPRHELLWAEWVLTPADPSKTQRGRTTLVFERQTNGWKIIADHSS